MINRKLKLEQRQLLPINHSIIIDGFAELKTHINYLPFDSFCGICDKNMLVTAAVQKHVVEVRQVPVKMMKRGALFCESCSKRRGRINFLKNGNKFLEEENGKAELIDIEKEEKELQSQSKGLYSAADWPY
jgi:hypothetical protein